MVALSFGIFFLLFALLILCRGEILSFGTGIWLLICLFGGGLSFLIAIIQFVISLF